MLGCGHSPSISGGVARLVSCKTVSREWGSRTGVTKMSRKDESQTGVTKLSHKDESGCKNKKFGGICIGYPKGSNKLIKNNVQNKYVV